MDGRVRLSTLGGKTIVDTDLDIIQPFLKELLIQFETVRFDWIGLKDTKPDVVNHFPFQGHKNLEIISKRETDIDGNFCFLICALNSLCRSFIFFIGFDHGTKNLY